MKFAYKQIIKKIMEDFISQSTIESVKHLWQQHCTSLGFGKRLKPLWKNKYKFLFGSMVYGILVWITTHDIVFSFLPLFTIFFLHLVIVVDLIYTSKKCVMVLDMVHKYIDSSIDMYEMLCIIKEDKELKDDIWF